MIVVQKGETLTSAATEDEVLFVEVNEDGDVVPVGRNKFDFEVLSGSVQVAVGKAVNTSKASAHTTSAAPKFSITINNQGYPSSGPQEGNFSNLRIVGAGTLSCTW